MEIIQSNPFRIAGILSNVTERELQRQKAKIKAYTKVGKEIKSDFDFEILDSISRTEESVSEAFSKIEQNHDKVNYSLFWFLNASPFDNTAIEYLKNGDKEKALEIWKKVTNDKDVSFKNFSAFNNLGTYKLLSNNQTEIKEGIEAKIKLIESDYFESFVHSVADQTYTIDKFKQSEKLIDELLTQLNMQYSSSETLQLFSGCNGTTQKYLSKKFTEQPLHNIESRIESCKRKRKADNSNAYEFGLSLFTNTKEDLLLLKSVVESNDLKYKAIADQLANEIMQCGIDYFNKSQELNSDENYPESAQKLLKLAKSIAVGKLTKDRVNENKKVIDESAESQVIQKELEIITNQLDFLEKRANSINDAINFIKTCEPELKKIKVSIGVSEFYQNVSSTVVNAALGFSIFIINSAQENARRIGLEGMKRIMSDEMTLLSMLSGMDMNEDVAENFAVNSRILKKNYTDLKNVKQSDGPCYIATMAYGDYDHPQVLELRKFRDDFLRKTIIGRSFIKFYYKYSPKLVEKLNHKQVVNSIIRKGLDQFIKAIR